jgi:hypothetical protein
LKQGTPAERALERELSFYRARAAKTLVGGILLLVVGVVLTFFVSAGGQGARNDLWLYRTYGEQGLIWGGRGIGILLMLLAAWMLYRARRRLTVGVRAREASSRSVLGLPAAASNAPRPSRAGFLAGLLVLVLVVAALYLLSQRL